MGAAAGAFAWEFRRRLRGGLIALAAYLVVLAAVQLLAPRPPIRAGRELLMAFTVIVPLFAAFTHLVAVFTHGLEGDLAARRSMYPARLFTLPVSTAALAGYPMLYGSLAVAGLYVVADLVAFRPAGLDLPVAWPPLFLAVFLAWMQAFTWMPYGLPGVRALIAVLALFALDAVVMVALDLHVRESVMIAILAPQVPLAYLAARYAVGRARRGEVPDWGIALGRLRERAGAAAGARSDFLSPRRAQLWFELRQHGRSLPGWVGIVVPFQLALLYVVRDEPRVLTAIALAGMLLTPPFVAAFVAATAGFTPFLATRPLSTAALAAAKLKMALSSAAAAWLLLLSALPLGITLSAAWPAALSRFDAVARFVGAPRTVALVLLAVAGLFASTWKQLVQGLCIGLTGREGLIKGSVLLRLCLLIALGLVLHGVLTSPELLRALWNGGPWILAALAVLKVCAAAWAAGRLARARLVGDRALQAAVASWLVAVGALYGVLSWLLDTPHVARYALLLVAILAVPLVRPALAVLALAWNRHRGTVRSSSAALAGAGRGAVFALLALPLAVALALAVSFQVRNRTNGVLISSGVEREYLLHVPRSYDPARPTPLVISMHGAGMWPAAQMETSGWNAVADAEGFLVVYPGGSGSGRMRVWEMGSGPEGRSEVRFISDLIDALRASYNVDPRRVYADGLSNGGGMAFVLSCTLSDRIAAVGLVASAQLLPWEWCTDDRPVPMINFHGTEDRFAPYHGGTSPVAPRPFPDVTAWTGNWARRNRCAATPAASRVAPDVTRLEYTGCADEASVVLYTIHGGGHTWPGGGPMPEWFAGRTSTSIAAAREAWRFFSAHPLRSGAAAAPATP